MKLVVSILIVCTLFCTNALAKSNSEVDYLSLAAILIKDKHFERARTALDNIKTPTNNDAQSSLSGGQIARYYTLNGLVNLHDKEYIKAKKFFIKAIDSSHGQPQFTENTQLIYVYLAQAAYGAQDYRNTLDALQHTGNLMNSMQELYTLKAQSHLHLQQPDQAWAVLLDGLRQFRNEPVFMRQQTFLLMQLGLYQQAIDIGNTYLTRTRASAHDYLAIGNALLKGNQAAEAISLLERAKLRYPQHVAIVVELAQAYIAQDKLLTAAELYTTAAMMDEQYLLEAAELFRRAGKLDRALNLNAQILDSGKKLKQRLAILIEQQDFELAGSMLRPLRRVGLMKDQNIRYAIGYSYFKSGEYEKAADQLNFITEAKLFRKSTELRQAMHECDTKAWLCY